MSRLSTRQSKHPDFFAAQSIATSKRIPTAIAFTLFGIKYCEWIIDVIQDGIELIKLVIESVRLGIENALGIEAS